jgi:hypothetical protein
MSFPGLVETPESGLPVKPGSKPGDLAAVADRKGRRETCVVNCAIMAKSYPHVGGRVLNKPIVVDLDLPVHTHGSD